MGFRSPAASVLFFYSVMHIYILFKWKYGILLVM